MGIGGPLGGVAHSVVDHVSRYTSDEKFGRCSSGERDGSRKQMTSRQALGVNVHACTRCCEAAT
jgi:hypothetical protein